MLVILFLSVAGLSALGRLRDPGSNVVVRTAAAFCLIAPLCFMTAPFLSETSRWPLLMGIAAGILARFGRKPGGRDPQPGRAGAGWPGTAGGTAYPPPPRAGAPST
ncbi:hypothetical protein ACGF7U_28000 [Micromonospora sp. NPDC047670]|uniref:hypothetical protein n=1 Tax=Micromonospora sp. NPDC047670 TaxID=3364252 RepID=UPI00371DE944